MTANAMRGDRERCLEAGMDGYMSKPIKSVELRKLLQELLVPNVLVNDAFANDVAMGTPFDYAAGMATVDGEVVGIIAEPFLVEWPLDLARLQAAMALNDIKGVLHVVHALKGTLAMFGAVPACELAAQLERQSQAGDASGMAALVAQLASEVSQLVVVLTQVVNSGGSAKFQ